MASPRGSPSRPMLTEPFPSQVAAMKVQPGPGGANVNEPEGALIDETSSSLETRLFSFLAPATATMGSGPLWPLHGIAAASNAVAIAALMVRARLFSEGLPLEAGCRPCTRYGAESKATASTARGRDCADMSTGRSVRCNAQRGRSRPAQTSAPGLLGPGVQRAGEQPDGRAGRRRWCKGSGTVPTRPGPVRRRRSRRRLQPAGTAHECPRGNQPRHRDGRPTATATGAAGR